MGDARATPCTAAEPEVKGGRKETVTIASYTEMYREMGYMHEDDMTGLTQGDPGASILPLVYVDSLHPMSFRAVFSSFFF